MFESCVVGKGILSDGLYRLDVNEHISFLTESYNSLSRYVLWNRRLGHISLDRMNRLMKDVILPTRSESSESCTECVKGKLTNTKKRGYITF